MLMIPACYIKPIVKYAIKTLQYKNPLITDCIKLSSGWSVVVVDNNGSKSTINIDQKIKNVYKSN